MEPRVRRHTHHPVGVRPPERLVTAPHDHDVARLDPDARPRGNGVELLRRDGVADGDEPFLAARGDVEEHATRRDATLEDRIDRAPRGAGCRETVLERPTVVEL